MNTEKKKGICGICPAGCWVELEMKEGRIVGIGPDTSHPLGMICRRGQHSPEIVYSEHRLKYPMKRTGPKGSNEFERITWDQAYGTIVERLNGIKAESGPEAVAIYTGRGAFELSLCDVFQPKGVAVGSASTVLFPFGSPNTMGVGALCYVSFAMIAPHVTMGRMLINMFTDMEHSELLVVWGANPATDSPPLDMYRLEAAARRGAEVVVIDPRRTETVEMCNAQWIPIRPGTDGALALGLIEVMIDEEIYDEEFVDKWTHGFEELARYVQHFRPEVVERITGVKAETIRALARRLCEAGGAAPVMYTGLEYANSGIQAMRGVFTLWALAGQMDVPGGLCFAGENSHFPINHDGNIAAPDGKLAIAADKFPLYSHYRGECHASGLVDAVLDGKPYPIKGLIIHGASLLTSWPETPVWKKTLSSLDFLVTIDRQLTADSAFADIVLPATTMFEIESYMTYGPIFRIREKCIEPVGEARNDYLIMAELARRLGYGHLYPQSEEELLSHILKGSGYTPDQVRKAGGWVKLPTHMMEYKKWEKGKCRPDGEPGFDTPTGKFEIYSTVLEDYGYEPLPKYTEPTEGPLANPGLAEKFPIVFNSGARPHTDFRSQHHGIEPLVRDNPEPSMEMNTADAKARGIESGDLVKLSSPRGSVQFRAQVSDRIVQGAIEANMGGGGPIGPKAWRESNVNNLTDLQNYDEISGFPVFKALLCEVEKAEEGTAQSRAVSTRVIRSMGHRLPVAAQKQPAVRIYLDNNATTEMDQQVRDAMMPFLSTAHGNPSSIHEMGRAAREGLRNARFHLARLLNCRPRRIIFTGSGSEADNLALKGVAFAHRDRGERIITTVVEHPAVLNCCKFLERNGYEVIYLPVDRSGRLDPEDLKKAITDGTILVSIMMVNNEVGTIFPIKELAKIAHARGVLFHTDAVQAAGKIPINVEDLDVDLLSLSGHKFHAPKGVGALFVKKGVELEPLVHGGKQEYGIRAGTENVASIVGMGRASELALDSLRRMDEVRELRDELQEKITSLLPDARLNGPSEPRIPNTINMTLPNLRGESMVIALDQKGVALSSGSACKSGSPEPSHALMAMGMSEEDAHCTVRFSLSRYTTGKEIAHTAVALEEVLEEMEAAVRFLPCK